MAMGTAPQLPVKAELAKRSKQAGDPVTVRLEQRLGE
jgi:hypothetical protein